MLGLAPTQMASLQWLLTGAALVGGALAGAGWARRATMRGLGRAVATPDDAARARDRGVPSQAAAPDDLAVKSLGATVEAVAERERALTELAMSDPETGLPNRRALDAELAALTAAGGDGAAALALSIDGFDALGAVIGHQAGLTLLTDLARRLGEKMPASIVGRLAPDTLALVIGSGGAAAAATTAAGLAAELEGPAPIGDATVDLSLAIGVAAAGRAEGDPSPLARASIAMSRARATRRKVAVFDARAQADGAGNLELLAEMQRAIAFGEIDVHLQPKYDLRQGRTVGAEALARWAHPKRGLLSPGVFVRLAEATGHIRALTDHVLGRAIADQAALRRAGHALDVSVNITGQLIADPAFVEHVLEAAAGAEGRVCLEVTEAGLLEDPERALKHIARLAEAGLGVAIDNFGAGLLPLSLLRQVRAEEVKIEQSLILDVADARKNTLLVRGVIELAHGLGMKVTAKGVETNETHALLSSLGCDFAQGFLIERPMPLPELTAFLAEDHAAARFG